MRQQALIGCVALGLSLFCASQVHAEKIKNEIAVFTALNKVTAKIKPLEIKIGETATFGTLKVTPRVCNTRPETEMPVTAAFVEVDEIQIDKSEKRIFTGWMFAQNPGAHAVEHPVFDVWLTGCKSPIGGDMPRPRGGGGGGGSWVPESGQ